MQSHQNSWIFVSYYDSHLIFLVSMASETSILSYVGSIYCVYKKFLTIISMSWCQILNLIMFFNVSIYFIDNKRLGFYPTWFCITNVVNNIFLWFFIYLDVIRIKIFYTDHIIEKEVRAIFDVNFFYTIRLYTITTNHW